MDTLTELVNRRLAAHIGDLMPANYAIFALPALAGSSEHRLLSNPILSRALEIGSASTASQEVSQSAFAESFNILMRDESLNESLFHGLGPRPS